MSENTCGWQPSFPGLAIESAGRVTQLEKAALSTLESLDAQGLLVAADALTVRLVIDLSRAIGAGLAYGKVTVATSTLVKQLLEAMDKLPRPASGSVDEEWTRLRAEINGGE